MGSDSMAYFCLLHSICLPCQYMRKSGHWVIDSHSSCYCHRNLGGKKKRVPQMKSQVYNIFDIYIEFIAVAMQIAIMECSSPHCPSVLFWKRVNGKSTLNESPLNVTVVLIAGIFKRSSIPVVVMEKSSFEYVGNTSLLLTET